MAKKRVKDMTPEEKTEHDKEKERRKIQKKILSRIRDDYLSVRHVENAISEFLDDIEKGRISSVSEFKAEIKEKDIKEGTPTINLLPDNPPEGHIKTKHYRDEIEACLEKAQKLVDSLQKLKE